MITTATARYLESAQFFPGWTREALEDYVAFHCQQQTLCVAVRDGKVTGVMVGWQQDEPRHIPFAWQPTNRQGGWWWWDQFKADDSESAIAVALVFSEAQPMCDILPACGLRNGKLRIYKPGAPFRIWKKGIQLYGNKCPST